MKAEELIAFEQQVAEAFNAGSIRSPIHLSGGNEAQLLRIFEDVRPGDWVLGSWRSHYHCLLHGVPPDKLMAAIRAGRSISLCFPEHRILCSAIVGGTLPIAVGIAMGIKRHRESINISTHLFDTPWPHVWCFVGDMTARTGGFYEAQQYSICQDLAITFVVENNGRSVLTDTEKAWGGRYNIIRPWIDKSPGLKMISYNYQLTWPHSGAGVRVEF